MKKKNLNILDFLHFLKHCEMRVARVKLLLNNTSAGQQGGYSHPLDVGRTGSVVQSAEEVSQLV